MFQPPQTPHIGLFVPIDKKHGPWATNGEYNVLPVLPKGTSHNADSITTTLPQTTQYLTVCFFKNFAARVILLGLKKDESLRPVT